MTHLLQPDRTLLYPQFETYKLHSLDADDDLTSYPLPGAGATQSRVGYNHHHLSFKQVRDRIGWDHLAVGEGGRGVYVDVDWRIIGFELDDNLKPIFTELASLPIPVSSKDLVDEPEYPSATQLDGNHWAISTGSGSIYILQTSPSTEPFSGSFTARYDLDTPFLLRTSHLISPTEVRLVLSRPSPSTVAEKGEKTFDLIEVSIDPTRVNTVDDSPERLGIRWSLQSGDLPYWCKWYQDGWMILATEEYRVSSGETSESKTTTTAGIPSSSRAGIGAEDESPLASTSKLETEDEREWPFSWTQTSDSISISIPFGAGTRRSDIAISLKPADFTLSLSASAPSPLPTLSNFLKRSTRSWWSEIDTGSSTFSYDSEKALLEFEIIKGDDRSRWPSLFTPLDDDDNEEEEEEEVPETLDADTLAAVRASFNNIKTRQPDEPAGNHPAMPALLTEEMDIDLDDDEEYDQVEGPFGDKGGKVGRDCYMGYIKDGTPSWTKTPLTVVSLPISSSTSKEQGEEGDNGLIVKSAIDGLYYRPPSSEPTKNAWRHTSTTPALAFVLSSKRDIRLVRHMTNTATEEARTTVLAFDAGSYGEQAQGNVYVYYPPEDKAYAKQGVVGVSGRARGALLGVGSLRVREKEVVVVLCEKELVVLHGVV